MTQTRGADGRRRGAPGRCRPDCGGRAECAEKTGGAGRGPGARASHRRRHRRPFYGALDLGTNNCRLLVAHPTRQGFRVVDAFSRLVRLGEGLSRTGRLGEAAMTRSVEALKVCTRKLKKRDVTRFRLIATEACRIAENGAQFISRVRSETSLKLEIVDQETEARLAVAGSASLLDHGCSHALVFDIGGGSTELMWVELCGGDYRIRGWTSIGRGVVNLAEKYGGVEVFPQTYEAMKQDVMNDLARFERAYGLRRILQRESFHLLGTSGTVTTIAGVVLGLKRYDRSRVDGCWISDRHIREVSRSLVDMDFEMRAASPCIGRERADLVVAGCAIAEAILTLWPCQRIRVADRGLREGILTLLMNEDREALRKNPFLPHRRPGRWRAGRRAAAGPAAVCAPRSGK